MKVWKGLFFVTLLLCATLFVVGVSAADDGTHTHPICGATHKEIGDHTGPCEAVEWTAWDGTSEIDYGENNTAYVYLSDNATRSDMLTVSGNTLYLCLNGKTLDTLIEVERGSTLNICDCRGGGEITNTKINTYTISAETVSSCAANTTLNIYGGKISASSASTIGLDNSAWGSELATVFNMYGGEVYNTYSAMSAAVEVYKSGHGIFKINVYGGKITSEKHSGISARNSDNAMTFIAGGTIVGGSEALSVIGNLTLAGSPVLNHTSNDGSDIDITTTSNAETENDYFIVRDDFALAKGTTISVEKAVGSTGSVLIATSASGSSLSDKAQYFVSAEEGYFVECDTDGNLRLTECAITEQPTKDNSYTVSANGNPKYQWWSTERGDVSVTSERATAGDFRYSASREEWSYGTSDVSSVTLEVFTLYMAVGDVLTLNNFSDYFSNFRITNVVFTRSGGSSTSVTGTGDTYTFTALEDGEYTLKITAEAYQMEYSYMNFSFTATVTDDVASDALSGQTDKTLNPETLGDGKYMCAVTWDDETTLYTNAVEFHKHTWNDGEITTEPTCTTAGEKTFICTTCNETKTETIDALGHDFTGGTWEHDADEHWKKCSRCGEIGAKSDHDWNDGEVTTDPTCTQTGEKTFICTTCNETKTEPIDALGHDFTGGTWEHDADEHWKKCSRCDVTDTRSAHDWDDGKVTTNPTCLATGVRTFTCTECSATKEETEPALGHDLVHHEAKAATCTEKGWDAYDTCSRCGHTTYKENAVLGHDFEGGEWKHDESQHWKQCSRCDVTDTRSAHDWDDGKVTTNPTCLATGVRTFTCTECSATKEETEPALGHDLIHHDAKAATCTEKGWDAYDTCSRCDYTTYKENPVLGHDFEGGKWQSDANQHWKKCSRCDVTDTKSAHDWDEGEETKAPTCTETGVKTFTCAKCSATKEETLDALGHDLKHHDAKAATCTETGWDAYDTCSRCDYTTYEEKDALGHDFTADTWEHDANNHWKECSRCDAIDAKAGHTGGTATCKDSAVCTVCSEAYGARDPRNHAGGVEIRGMAEATTKKEGHTGDSYCKGCNAKLSEGTVIPVISDLSTDKKSDLRSAVEEMEKALSDRSDVYTEEQKELLTDSINATKAALKSIENAEEAVKRADAMPAADKTRPDDEAAIGAYEAAKKAYDDLSADEKRMAGERTKEALDAMLKALTDYDITNGNGSTWTADDKNDGLTFTVNGYHKKFAGVVINGTVIDPKYYDIKVGSTVITLKPEYLETLSAGEYTLLVRYTDGSTDGKDTFTITKAAAADPDAPTALKGEDYALLVMACGVALLLIGIAVLIRYFDKRREER